MSAKLTLTDGEMSVLISGLRALRERVADDNVMLSAETKLLKGLNRPGRRRPRRKL